MFKRWSMISTFLLSIPAYGAFENEPVTFGMTGYWKSRGTYIRNLFLGQNNFTDIGRTIDEPALPRQRALQDLGFVEHGLRVQPTVAFQQIIKLKVDLDILDGVVWGDNDAVASTPIFAGSPSSTSRDGNRVDTIGVRRAWVELNVPVGILRVGRQPSQWGMGLLANAGDGLDADFGEYRRGSTVDRALFATRPLELAKTIMGSEHPKSPLVLAVAYDQLVSDAIHDRDPDLERSCESCAPQILLADPRDDVKEWVGVLLWKDDHARILEENDIVQAGVYTVYRTQHSTKSKVLVVDGHIKLRIGPAGLESELLWISGKSSALSGSNPKDVSIKGGVVRGGYYRSLYDAELEIGYAPGDTEPLDKKFTGYPLHADYNVGLLLYEEVLAARTARVWGQEARGLWSNGGVYNSRYIQPKMRYRPIEGLTLIGAFLWARANVDNAAVWAENQKPRQSSDLNLGWEIDAAARYDFAGHAHIKLEGGVFFPGKALWKDVQPRPADLRITEADQAKTAYTVQARLGYVF